MSDRVCANFSNKSISPTAPSNAPLTAKRIALGTKMPLGKQSSGQRSARLSDQVGLRQMHNPQIAAQSSIFSIQPLSVNTRTSNPKPKNDTRNVLRSISSQDSTESLLFKDLGAKFFESRATLFSEVSHVRVLPLESAHQEDINQLLLISFPHIVEPAQRDVKNFLSSDAAKHRSCFWILTDSNTNKAVGITGLYQKDGKLWLNWFTVHPDFRGQGLGRKLLRLSMDVAKKIGNHQYLYVETSNRPSQSSAQKLYESMGFKLFDQKPSSISSFTIYFRKAHLGKAQG